MNQFIEQQLSDSIRLAKFLASAGVASRRNCEKVIRDGQVSINGKVVTDPAFKITTNDKIRVKGKSVQYIAKKIYIMLNKPRGVSSTCYDPYAEKTVLDLVPLRNIRLFPVGRLDKDSEGFIILTNDGEFANRICHPKFRIPKTYVIRTDKNLLEEEIHKLLHGVKDEGELLRAEKIVKKSNKVYTIIMLEGKKREVRRLIDNHTCARIKRLRRTAIGAVCLDRKLPAGRWRYMTKEEVEKLLQPTEKKGKK